MSDTANDRQHGGDHYKKHGKSGEQHWDRVARIYGPASYVYFASCATKYIERYREKGGITDLEKARHYIDKLIELETLWKSTTTNASLPEPSVINPPLLSESERRQGQSAFSTPSSE